jgi:hypothetical protein
MQDNTTKLIIVGLICATILVSLFAVPGIITAIYPAGLGSHHAGGDYCPCGNTGIKCSCQLHPWHRLARSPFYADLENVLRRYGRTLHSGVVLENDRAELKYARLDDTYYPGVTDAGEAGAVGSEPANVGSKGDAPKPNAGSSLIREPNGEWYDPEAKKVRDVIWGIVRPRASTTVHRIVDVDMFSDYARTEPNDAPKK